MPKDIVDYLIFEILSKDFVTLFKLICEKVYYMILSMGFFFFLLSYIRVFCSLVLPTFFSYRSGHTTLAYARDFGVRQDIAGSYFTIPHN